MEDDQTECAKKIYFQYSGNKFQMMRDGIIDEYMGYNISERQEKEWLNELIEININQLNINNPDSLFPLWYIIINHCEPIYLDKIIDFVYANKSKAIDKEILLAFITKIEEVIDRMNTTCNHIPITVSRYRNRIILFKSENNI